MEYRTIGIFRQERMFTSETEMDSVEIGCEETSDSYKRLYYTKETLEAEVVVVEAVDPVRTYGGLIGGILVVGPNGKRPDVDCLMWWSNVVDPGYYNGFY